VLTVFPGSSLSALHVAVRVYNQNFRAIFEQMLEDKDVRREAVKFKGNISYRHYTNHPVTPEPEVITPST